MPLCLDHAHRVLVATLREPCSHGFAGELFIGPEVGEGTQLSRGRFAGIEADNRNACIGGLLQRLLQARREWPG